MRPRHKPPTLVSMWMLDVFCCALGCMILLFVLANVQAQLSAMQAQLRAAEAVKSDAYGKKLAADLSATRDRLDATLADLSAERDKFDKTSRALNADIEDLKGKLAAVTDDRDKKAQTLTAVTADRDTKMQALDAATADREKKAKALAAADAELNAAKEKLASTAADLKQAQGRLSDANAELVRSAAIEENLLDELRKKELRVTELDTKVTKLTQEEADLQKLLRATKEVAESMTSAKKTADDALSSLDAKYRSLQKEATDSAAALKAAGKVDEELAAARGVIKDLQKKYDDRNAVIIDLENKNQGLKEKADKLKAESESRFAGIAMTGKKVVFVVDASGSMTHVDEKTPDKNKWPGVVATVGKVMRSLPDLEQYQVIVFGHEAKYLFGDDKWRAFKGAESAKEVTDKLEALVPGTDTNLYDAFDLAFKLRPSGMDTVYLFSDGLPTSGASGLATSEEKKLTDAQLAITLSKYLRGTLTGRWNKEENGKRVRINAIGFFYESPEVGAFLWALARENDGSFVGMSKP